MRVCLHAGVRVCERASVHAWARESVRVRVSTRACVVCLVVYIYHICRELYILILSDDLLPLLSFSK